MKKRLEGEHILVVGFYRTGLQTANFLLSRGIRVSITDIKSEQELAGDREKLLKPVENFFTGNQTPDQLKGIDRIILSPGVPRIIPLIQKAIEMGIPIWSEIQLAYNYLPQDITIIGVTGTDGKSTTVSLIHALLSTTYRTFLCGNIGTPFISFIPEIQPCDKVVLELSSYQLEDNESFRCDIACILNISEDHLDRYPSLDAYMSAKENILKMQNKTGIAVLNADSEYFERQKEWVHGKLVAFSRLQKNQIAIIDNNNIIYNKEHICPIDTIKIKGVHNLENALCAVAVAKELNVSAQNLSKVLQEFAGLEHRNEHVAVVNGVEFINDSKATTVNAVRKAIESQVKPVVLMLGGRDKGLDFSKLNDLLPGRVKHIVYFGEARNKIAGEIGTGISFDIVQGFREAVETGYKRAENGDAVLLSPGCTSWDEFKSYAERGEVFKKIVRELK